METKHSQAEDISKQIEAMDALAKAAIARGWKTAIVPLRLSRNCSTPWTIAESLHACVGTMTEAGYDLAHHSLSILRTSSTTVDEVVIAVFKRAEAVPKK